MDLTDSGVRDEIPQPHDIGAFAGENLRTIRAERCGFGSVSVRWSDGLECRQIKQLGSGQ
jgi:hypothetical protein